MRLKICDSHFTCKVANKCLNVCERVEVVEWNKMVPSLPLLSCELSVSVKENPDRKKINSSNGFDIALTNVEVTLKQHCINIVQRCFDIVSTSGTDVVSTLFNFVWIRRRILFYFERRISVILTLIHSAEKTLSVVENLAWLSLFFFFFFFTFNGIRQPLLNWFKNIRGLRSLTSSIDLTISAIILSNVYVLHFLLEN